jgi:hypothetical protein
LNEEDLWDPHPKMGELPHEEHLEEPVVGLAFGTHEEVHRVLIAETAVEVEVDPTGLGDIQTGWEEAPHVRNRVEQVVVPFVGAHMVREVQKSVLAQVHDPEEHHIDWVQVVVEVSLEEETSFLQVEASILLCGSQVCLEGDTFRQPGEAAVGHSFVVPEAEAEQVVLEHSQGVGEGNSTGRC